MITGHVSGDAEVVRRLESIGPQMKVALRQGIGRLVTQLQKNVRQNKLSGQVLNVRSGRLYRSIEQVVEEQGEKVVGIVSTAVKYAAVHEYGFKGTVNVREHMRRTKNGSHSVRAHTARVDLPERSFLRSALRELDASGAVTAEIEAAIAKVIL